VHDAHFVDATLGDGLSFRAMMDAMKSDSFVSTQTHATGSGDTDPTVAYYRKPGMLITPQSRTWIDIRLKEKLRVHGEVDLGLKRFSYPGLTLKQLGFPNH
jgi:hypothetical protein